MDSPPSHSDDRRKPAFSGAAVHPRQMPSAAAGDATVVFEPGASAPKPASAPESVPGVKPPRGGLAGLKTPRKSRRRASAAPPAKPRRRVDPRQRRKSAFIARYTERRQPVALELFAEVAARYGYRVEGDWQRARCAVLLVACEEYERVALSLTGGRARRLVANRFRGLPLGESSTGKAKTMQLGHVALWRALRLWRRADRVSPAIFTVHRLRCGRPPKPR